MKEKTDLRIVKSKRNLLIAFYELLKVNSFEDITVVDVCQKANVNRMTFYNHYQDKYDLLNDFLKKIKDEMTKVILQKCVKLKWPEDELTYVINFMDICIDVIYDNSDVVLNLIRSHKEDIATFMLLKFCQDSALELVKSMQLTEGSGLPIAFISSFISGGAAGVLFYWITHKEDITKKEFKDYAFKTVKVIFDSDLFK